jgi:hypothetical protein
MTRTEAAARTSSVSGPASWAATSKSRAAREAAAAASEESAGWAGCICSATSGRMLQASEWASSKSTVASLGGVGSVDADGMDIKLSRRLDGVNPRFLAISRRIPSYGRG